MKKTLLIALVASAVVFGITSCNKLDCEICTKASSPETRLCEEDYANHTEYGLAVDALEVQGYNCR